MSVVAQFRCVSVEPIRHHVSGNERRTVTLTPTHADGTDPDAPNLRLWPEHAEGLIQLAGISVAAAGQFTPGKHYFVEFHDAPVPVAPAPTAAEPAPAVDPVSPTTAPAS